MLKILKTKRALQKQVSHVSSCDRTSVRTELKVRAKTTSGAKGFEKLSEAEEFVSCP